MTKRTFTAALAAVAVAAFAAPAGAADPKPVTVWEDDEGDADMSQGVAEPFVQAGFDITAGKIQRNGDNLEFVVEHSAMPPTGTPPETFRFLWAFNVGNTGYRITAKRGDVGDPDVLNNETTERIGRVDPNGHFRLEGDCKTEPAIVILQPINCEPLAYVEGSWDPANKSFTVIIPLKAIKAKPGTKITGGAGDNTGICQICWVSHAAERSHSDTIIDTAVQTKAYKVPK